MASIFGKHWVNRFLLTFFFFLSWIISGTWCFTEYAFKSVKLHISNLSVTPELAGVLWFCPNGNWFYPKGYELLSAEGSWGGLTRLIVYSS